MWPLSSSMRMAAATSAAIIALHLMPVAHADPAPTPDVAGAPVPGTESGQTWNDEGPEGSIPRNLGRAILFIPKSVAYLILLPVRGGVYLYDKYDLNNRYYATFYNATRTFGIIPVVEYATGFSIMFGGRLISKDTFGDNEQFTMMGAYGGTYQSRAEAWLDSGDRFDPVKVTIGGNFDRFARLAFYGIGNNDNTLDMPPPTLIDPLVNDTAVQTFYRYQELRAALTVDYTIIDDLHLVGHGAVTDIKTTPSTRDPSIQEVYNPMDLVGFDTSTTHGYGQIEARWDTRRTAVPQWETTGYTTGYLVSGYVGGVQGLGDAHNFAHYGVDLQAFIHFALGPRMLWLRFLGEGVTGELNEIPFPELPYLGGDILRGYDYARFRDRVSGVATAQYTWDLSRFTNAYLFVDAGRVYSSLDDLTLDNMRVGFGGGIELHSSKDFLLAATLASSIDGGAFVSAVLTPYHSMVPRWR